MLGSLGFPLSLNIWKPPHPTFRGGQAGLIALLVYLCVINAPTLLLCAATVVLVGLLCVGAAPAVLLLMALCSWGLNLLQKILPQFAIDAITAIVRPVARGMQMVVFQVGLFLEWIKFQEALRWLQVRATEARMLMTMLLAVLGLVVWGIALYGCIAYGFGVVQRPALSLAATTLVCWLWLSFLFMLVSCIHFWRMAVRDRRAALAQLQAAKLGALPAP